MAYGRGAGAVGVRGGVVEAIVPESFLPTLAARVTLRAVPVVDTGIHAFGWNRQQATDYMRNNTGKDEHEITTEVDRYIALPGHALAYKVGQLKISGLRNYARAQLGDAFDIRAFHDAVLASGGLPPDVLERLIYA